MDGSQSARTGRQKAEKQMKREVREKMEYCGNRFQTMGSVKTGIEVRVAEQGGREAE